MAEPSNTTMCLTILVDSSLSLAAEWSELLQKHVSPLVSRLHEAHKARSVSSVLDSATHLRLINTSFAWLVCAMPPVPLGQALFYPEHVSLEQPS